MDKYTNIWQKFLETNDVSLFETIYRQYLKTSTFRAYNILRDTQAAKDVVQEVFINLFEKGKKQELEREQKQKQKQNTEAKTEKKKKQKKIKNFAAYLNKMIYHECLKYLKQKHLSLDELGQEAGNEEAFLAFMEKFEHKRLHQAIEMLTKKNYKKVMKMSLQGLRNPEIALRLGKKEKYVRDIKVSAKKQLKEILKA